MAKRPTSTPKSTTAEKPDQNSAPPRDIAALVAAWDDARTGWKQAGDGFKAATEALEALAADASTADRDAAKQLLDEAQIALTAAEATITALSQSVDGTQLLGEVQAALTKAEATIASLSISINETNTTPSEGKDGGTGDLAGPAGGALDEVSMDVDFRMDEIRALGELSRDDAIAMLDGDLAMIRGAIKAGAEVEARFVSLRAELQPSLGDLIGGMLGGLLGEGATPGPFAVEVKATTDSRWRIGREFTKETQHFEAGALTAGDLVALKADPMLVVTELAAD